MDNWLYFKYKLATVLWRMTRKFAAIVRDVDMRAFNLLMSVSEEMRDRAWVKIGIE